MKMRTVAQILMLVAVSIFFLGCGGIGAASGTGGSQFRAYAANCYMPVYGSNGSGTTPSVSPTREGNPTYWCSNPPKITTPAVTPTPSPGTGTSQ